MIVLDKLVEDMEELSEKTTNNSDISTTYRSVCKLTDEYENILKDNLTRATINLLTKEGICRDIDLDSKFAYQIRKQIEMSLAYPELTSEDFHNLWLEDIKEKGFIKGDVYSERHKTHPNIISYSELDTNIHKKDDIIDSLVGGFV